MELQRDAEGFADGLLGEIVVGGAEAAGGDDDVGPPLGDGQGVLQPLGVVPHHGVVVDVDSQGAEPLGEHLGVRIGDVAQEQLGTHGDQFRIVAHCICTSQSPTRTAAQVHRKFAASAKNYCFFIIKRIPPPILFLKKENGPRPVQEKNYLPNRDSFLFSGKRGSPFAADRVPPASTSALPADAQRWCGGKQ